jgi:hypothetical protein
VTSGGKNHLFFTKNHLLKDTSTYVSAGVGKNMVQKRVKNEQKSAKMTQK